MGKSLKCARPKQRRTSEIAFGFLSPINLQAQLCCQVAGLFLQPRYQIAEIMLEITLETAFEIMIEITLEITLETMLEITFEIMLEIMRGHSGDTAWRVATAR